MSCMDCVYQIPGDCETFFMSTRGTLQEETRVQEEMRRSAHAELEKSIGEHLDRACCARPRGKPWMPWECKREHCVLHAHQHGLARVAHTLRHLHRDQGSKHSDALRKSMTPADLVATDLLAPQSHSIEECRRNAHPSAAPRDPLSGPSTRNV